MGTEILKTREFSTFLIKQDKVFRKYERLKILVED